MIRPQPPKPRSNPATLWACGLLSWLAAVAGGCGHSRHATDPRDVAAGSLPQAVRRLDVAWGTTVVAPAALVGTLSSSELATARMDDGRPVRFSTRWLGASAGPASGQGWLPPVGVWTVAERDPRDAGRAGTSEEAANPVGTRYAEFVVLTIPPGASGQSVWVGDRRLELSWLPSSVYLTDANSGLSWDSPLSQEMRQSRLVERAAADEALSPFRRWRSRLVRGELAPRELHTEIGDPDTRPDVMSSPELEQIALQVEERWRVALARVFADSPELFRSLVGALTACANLGGISKADAGITPITSGEWTPVWPTDQTRLDELLAELLTPNLSPGLRRRTIEDFFDTLPRGAAWPADYAAGIDGRSRAPIPMIGLANFTRTALAAAAKPLSNPNAPGMITIPPMTGRVVPVWPWEDCPPLDRIRCDTGDAGVSIPVPLAATAVRPPGLLLGPLMRCWRLDTLVNGEPELSPTPPVAVSLMRSASATPSQRPEAAGWFLFMERDSEVTSARVEVWLGPAGGGRTPMIVDHAGPRVKTVEIPREAVSEGILLIGLRVSAAQISNQSPVLTWPLPILPWADEPARQALDLREWSGIVARPGSK